MKKRYVYILLFVISISSLSLGNIVDGTDEIEAMEDAAITKKECADAWIIIGGDRADHEASNLVLLTIEWVYDVILACGYTDDDIYYLVPDVSKGLTAREDAVTSKSNIGYAIKNWAAQKVPANGALGIYAHDHGGSNFMCIAPDGSYTAQQLDNDLDQFEATSGCDRVFIVYEACTSGSFLDEPSKSDRIILTSTDNQHSAWWSPVPPHISMFGEAFFKSVQAGNSVGDAFEDATAEVIALGYGQLQYPCIEDNHDGVGHIVNAWGCLPSTGDGNDAKNTYICTGCPSIKLILPIFLKIPLKLWVKYTPGVVIFPLEVKVYNETPLEKVFCRIVPSDWVPPPPRDNESMGKVDPNEASYQWELTYRGNGICNGTVEILSPVNNSEYRLSFVVEDEDGTKGPILSSRLGLNGDGKAPPDVTNPDLYITNPAAGANVSGTINITAIGKDDQELDEIKIYIDGTLVNTTTMPDYLPYPEAVYSCDTTAYSNGGHNITATAKDKTGNTNTTSILITIANEGTEGIPSFQIIPVIIGCLLVAITVDVIVKKKSELVFSHYY